MARVLVLEDLALDPVEADLHLVGDAAVIERLDQRFVGVLQPRVLADDGDRHVALRIVDAVRHGAPAAHVGAWRRFDVERREHFAVETGGMIGGRHVVDIGNVARLDDGGLADVAEQAEFAPLVARDRAVGAAEQDVRLNADRAQLFHGVLRRLGLQLAGARDVGQQRQVDVDGVPAGKVVAELPDGLEERQPLDVADRAADFDEDEVDGVVALEHELLDGVGDVRHDLHGPAEVVAAPLARDDVLIDAARRDVVLPVAGTAGEALVVPEIEVGFPRRRQ